MTTRIPYIEAARPDTRVTNGVVGIGLFLCSELMFFGSLAMAYTLLRLSGAQWSSLPAGLSGEAFEATALLLASSLSMVFALKVTNERHFSPILTAITSFAALAFVVVKMSSLAIAWRSGYVPASSTEAALFYAFSGLHALHVAAGCVWAGILSLQGRRALKDFTLPSPRRRGRLLAAYWTFVDVIWVVILLFFYIS